MFSLIITIISIALVAALALATLYYGGSAFNKGSAGAEAARLINEGQQVNGAVSIYKSDVALDSSLAGSVVNVEDLTASPGNYLSQVPSSFTAIAATTAITTQLTADASDEVCNEVNKRAGLTTRPADLTAAATAGTVFGCFGAAAVPGTFFYKL